MDVRVVFLCICCGGVRWNERRGMVRGCERGYGKMGGRWRMMVWAGVWPRQGIFSCIGGG